MEHAESPPALLPAQRRRSPWVASFFLALIVYAALRAWIVATAFDAIAIPVYEIATIGSYSWTLSEGPALLPWSDHYDNAGAQILTSWLGALSYSLFGASYLALKLVPMAFGVVLLALVGRMLARFFSGRAALFGMLSVAVAPPIVTKYSMLAKGNHFEGLTLLFAALLLALEVPEPRTQRRWLWVLAAGGALGFAVSMYFGALLAGAVVTFVWLTRFGISRGLRDLPVFIAGVCVGLLPFLAINLATHGRARAFGIELGSPKVEVPLEGVVAKGRSLVVDTLPDAACFEGALGMSPHVAETVLLVLTVIAWLIVAAMWLGTFRRASDLQVEERRGQRAAAAVLLIYPLGVLGVLALKGLPIMPKNPPVEILGVRYLLGYYFFSLLLIAVATDRLLGAAARPMKGVGALMGLALLFTWPFTAAIATTGHWSARGDGLGYPGVHLRQYAILFHWDLRAARGGEMDTTRMKGYLQRLEDEGHRDQRSELAMGIGSFLSMAGAGYKGEGARTDVPFELDSILLDFEEADRPDLLRGVGMYFQAAARSHALRPRKGKPSLLRRQIDYVLTDDEVSPWIAEGFGMGQQYPLLRRLAGEVNRSRNLLAIVPESLREHTLRGLARTLASYVNMGLGRAKGAVEAQIRKLDAADQVVLREMVRQELE